MIRREGPGYVLDTSAIDIDATEFEALAQQGRQLAGPRSGGGAGAVRPGARAVAWAGLADLVDMDWARAAAARLDELRSGVLEARFDAMLQLGRHDAVVGLLEAAIGENPLRERFTGQLMLALYRCGRQAEALRAYERTRLRLLDDLGLDPSPELVRLESAILAHDPSLAARPMPVGAAVVDPGSAACRGRIRRRSCRCRPPWSAIGSAPSSGRAAEMEALRKAWQHVLDGQRRFVVIEGEAGSGKSGPRRQVRGRGQRVRARSCCGVVPPPRPSCRTNRWSRRCARSCARCRPRRGTASSVDDPG